MIDPVIRLSYIGWASQFVLNKEQIASVWVDKKKGVTSVTEFDELYEQLFDDLDMDEFERDLPSLDMVDTDSRNKLIDFLNGVRDVDNAIKGTSSLQDPARLLESNPWKSFEAVCQRALTVPAVQEALKSERG
jgi:hypothetical protein